MYLEAYTSILMVQKDRLVRNSLHDRPIHIHSNQVRKEAFYGKELIVADRDMVETASDDILRDADKEDVSLLVVGDPYGCIPTGASSSTIVLMMAVIR